MSGNRTVEKCTKTFNGNEGVEPKNPMMLMIRADLLLEIVYITDIKKKKTTKNLHYC